MSDQEEVNLPLIEDPEEWARVQAENEISEEERVKLTAEAVKKENKQT